MDFQKVNKKKWFIKYINQFSQQLHAQVVQEPFFSSQSLKYFLSPVLWSVSRTHFCNWHHTGMVEVAVQEGTYCERVSVSGVTAVSWNNIYVLDIFSPTLLSAAWLEKKSRLPFSHIPACSLLNKQRCEDRTVQVCCELRAHVCFSQPFEVSPQ